jgi:hypothetical protein
MYFLLDVSPKGLTRLAKKDRGENNKAGPFRDAIKAEGERGFSP